MMLNNFKEEGLNYNKSEVYWSPMRLTLCVEGMDSKSKDISINKRGPRFDANDSAINGFARGLEVNKSDLIVEETEKGKFYFYKNLKKGTSAEIIIENAIKDIIVSFPWKKSMRWGSNNLKWIRPLHNILCIFDLALYKNVHVNLCKRDYKFLGKFTKFLKLISSKIKLLDSAEYIGK